MFGLEITTVMIWTTTWIVAMMVGIVVDLMLTLHIVVSVNAVMIVVVMQQVQVSTCINFSKENQIMKKQTKTICPLWMLLCTSSWKKRINDEKEAKTMGQLWMFHSFSSWKRRSMTKKRQRQKGQYYWCYIVSFQC